MWYRYVRQPGSPEKRQQREKIIDRELAAKYHIGTDSSAPLTKSDAQKVLDLLIAQDSGTYTPPNTEATVAMVAREYLALAQPNWGPHMVQSATSIVTTHIINGPLASRSITSVTEPELQTWLNRHVSAGASQSMLKGMLLHIRGVFKHARKQRIMSENPTEDLRARSKKRPCERSLALDECKKLEAAMKSFRDRLIVRVAIQCGLRSEELFALRGDDVQVDQLRIDEALVYGQSARLKTIASGGSVFIPPGLRAELSEWIESSEIGPRDWLFQTAHGRPGYLNANNYLKRTLKPAAIKAGIGLITTKDKHGKLVVKTNVDFRALRRTCATLFGDRAKDPKSTQAQLRHADPTITLRHYQKSVPASVQAAAIALEADLGFAPVLKEQRQ